MSRRQRYDQVDQTENNVDTLHICILDFLHTRFELDVPANCTVLHLKELGQNLHNVAVDQQRLIFQGKLLDDTSLLTDLNIANNSIVHLFPRPRVVIENNNNESSDESQEEANVRTGNVPVIRIGQEEAERRSEILVLGNTDYQESVNNVKLFSFMLLIISLIELMNVMSVYNNKDSVSSNNKYDDTDDFFDHKNHTSYDEPQDPQIVAEAIFTTWTNLSWLDLVVSVAGVYVAFLGIRASNENHVRTAKLYCVGLIFTAIGWLIYNLLITWHVDEVIAEENSSDTAFSEAVQVMILPGIVWGMCIFRAFQFHSILVEAEEEANVRLHAQPSPDIETA